MKIVIQGYPGSFHDMACREYFKEEEPTVIAADTFEILGNQLAFNPEIDYAIMAIENSIAGSILPNYRILREKQLNIIGEIYVRIEMNLMALPGVTLEDIREVHSHPMAHHQCKGYLNQFPVMKTVTTEDTALSAKRIKENQSPHIAAIAAETAADIYGLNILAQGIEDNKQNFTRFLILSRDKNESQNTDKASIWVRVSHHKGSLLKVLQHITDHQINLSKLQSFPVLGELTEYYFHMDLEFDTIDLYSNCLIDIQNSTLEVKELGRYKRADISAALRKEKINVLI